MTPRQVERFWSHVEKTGTCWLWTGGVNRRGYGKVHLRPRHLSAHRVSWEMANGPIPAGLFVCHHCDTPRCVNPSHLFLGTARDNMRDASGKGRLLMGERHWTHSQPEKMQRAHEHWTHRHPEKVARGDNAGPRKRIETRPRGSAHGQSKLTEAQVVEIRRRYAAGDVTQQHMADELGVSQVLISRVVRGVYWRHVGQ